MPDQDFHPMAIQPGTCIGPYRVLGHLGHGGMGAVYRVERDGLHFALKISTQKYSELSSDERAQVEGRVRREVSALAALCHPNVVRIHAFDRYPDAVNGHLYLVMDYVEGQRLGAWQRKHRPSLRAVAGVFLKIARALQELHAHGVHHRDIKSANVLVRGDGEPILIDFGIARAERAGTLTRAGTIIGTSTHLSPEYARHVVRGLGGADERYTFRATDDLHAVGVMLYQALTGRPPFAVKDGDEWGLLHNIASHVPERPRAVNPLVPAGFDDVAMKLLAKEPAARFQSGDELAQALESALAGADAGWDVPFERPSSSPPDPARTRNARGSQEKAQAGVPGIVELLLPQPPAAAASASAPAAAAPPASPPPAPAPEKPAFAPPTVAAKAFQAPDPGGATSAPAEEPRAPGLPTAIRMASQLSRPAPPRRPHVLVGVGLLAGAALIGLALATSPREERPRPRSLLQEHVQADRTGGPPPPLVVAAAPSSPPAVVPPPAPPPGSQPPSRAQAEGAGRAKRGAAPVHRPPPRADDARPPTDDTPSWLKGAADAPRPAAPAASAASASLGVPSGAHIRVRLKSSLDSRALGDGLVEAVLVRPHVERGDAVLPSRTTLHGRAQLSGGRFLLQITRLTLPGGAEVVLKASAFDIDGRPGLAAARRIRAEEPAQPGLPEAVARRAADTLLGQVGGNPVADAAGAAGRQVLDTKGASAGRVTEAFLLDAGADFDVVVQEAF